MDVDYQLDGLALEEVDMEGHIDMKELAEELFNMRRAFDTLAMAVSSMGGPKSKRLLNREQVLHEKANGNWSLSYFENVVRRKVKAYMFGGREMYYEQDIDRFIAEHAIDDYSGKQCEFLNRERDLFPNNPKPRRYK